MALAPWKVRLTADGSGTLGAVHATIELVDRAKLELGVLISGEAGIQNFAGTTSTWGYNDSNEPGGWWTGVSANGGIVAAVRYEPATVVALSPTGSLLWETAITAGSGVDVAAGADGSVYVVTEGPARVYKFDPSGTQVWFYEFSTGSNDGTNARVAVSPSGEVAVLTSGPTNYVAVLNPNGTIKWQVDLDTFTVQAGAFPTLAGEGSILIDTAGNVIFGSSDRTVRKLAAADGTLQWQTTLSGSGGFADYVYGLAFHQDGFVAGQGTSVFYLGADGTLVDSVDVGHGMFRVVSDGTRVYVLDPGGSSGGTLTVLLGTSIEYSFEHTNPFAYGLAVPS